ncbi:MAG: ribonuclease HI [Myxococcaceae bacterium]
MSEAITSVEIFTDGACKGNPGPGGWGALLRSGKHQREMWGGAKDTTNNRMELTAVIESLKVLTRPVRVKVHTDSTYVQQGITAWIHSWKRNGWKTKTKEAVKNADLWQALDALVQKHEVSWHWVKGHSGHPENELADMLANRGVDELLSRG